MSEKKANKNSHTKERLKTTIADPKKNTQAINAEKKKPQNSKRASSTKKSHKIAQPSTISSVTKTVSQEKNIRSPCTRSRIRRSACKATFTTLL